MQRFQVCSHRHSSPVGWIARLLKARWDNALHNLSSVQKQWHPHSQGSSDKGHGSQTQRGTDKTTAESQKKTTERYLKEWCVRKKGKTYLQHPGFQAITRQFIQTSCNQNPLPWISELWSGFIMQFNNKVLIRAKGMTYWFHIKPWSLAGFMPTSAKTIAVNFLIAEV